jgi:hypothetical protein
MMTGRDPTGERSRASGGDADDVEEQHRGGALATRRPREVTVTTRPVNTDLSEYTTASDKSVSVRPARHE